MIAAIAEKKKVRRSQRSYENHFPAIVVAAIATIAGKWFPYDRYDRCNRWTFFLSDLNDRSDHMETRLKLRIFTTPFAVHYDKIRIHLREKATNSAKIHSLVRKSEHLRVSQIQ